MAVVLEDNNDNSMVKLSEI